MASLSAHLRQAEAHARLSFHPDCPICRAERLSGTLTMQPLVGRRTQAAVLAGVLATSAAAPAVAVAQEPDQVSEGTIAPEQAGQDPALDPDFDPGGESDDLPFDEAGGSESESAPDPELGDPGPLDQEPATDVDAPVADAGDDADDPGATTTSPVVTVTPTPSPTPVVDDAGNTTPPAPAADDEVTPAPGGPQSAAKAERRQTSRAHDRKKQSQEPSSAPEAVVPAETVAPTPLSDVAPAVDAPAPVVAVAARGSVEQGDRVHIVRPGESLWSIASDVLGSDASTTRIAREVNRLWELNRTRIATGDPDLLIVGTSLRLR